MFIDLNKVSLVLTLNVGIVLFVLVPVSVHLTKLLKVYNGKDTMENGAEILQSFDN